MKPAHALIALLLCAPVAAMAQTPPSPPPAPARPPAPAIPAAPVVPVVPPVPPQPLMIDPFDVEEALRAARDAVRDLDLDAINQQALQKVDVEAIKEQVERMKEDAIVQTRQMAERSMDFQNFAFQMRGPTVIVRGRAQDDLYNSGLSFLQRRQYDQAVTRLDQVIAQKGTHADGALYWKAYAEYKLGRTADALAALNELRQQYGQSRYLSDARALEADVRKSSGQPLNANADDDEIKLLAIQGIQNSNPDGAIPLLEGVLKATNSLQVKKRALFVLAQNDQPAAHQLLISYAKGSGNPDLQLEAIRYLVDRRRQTTGAELNEIYNATQDVEVRRAVLDALISSRDRPALLKIVGSDSSPDIKRRAISGLGSNGLMAPQELMDLYRKEQDSGLRMTIVRAMGSMGAADQLTQVIKTESDPAVRLQAIRSLGSQKPEATGQALVDLYGANQDKDVRKAVISALGSQENADGLIAIARKETSTDLKLDIVRRISDIAPKNKAAMDYLMELIK